MADLLGQVKPPVASKEDIDRAGLQIIKAELLKQYESDGKITSNTTDRVSFLLHTWLTLTGRLLIVCFGTFSVSSACPIMSRKKTFGSCLASTPSIRIVWTSGLRLAGTTALRVARR